MKTSELKEYSFSIPFPAIVITILSCIYLNYKTNQNEWAYIAAYWICYSGFVFFGISKLYFLCNKLIIVEESNRHYGSYNCLIGNEKAFCKVIASNNLQWPAIRTNDGLIYAVSDVKESYNKITYVIGKLGCSVTQTKGYVSRTGFVANS